MSPRPEEVSVMVDTRLVLAGLWTALMLVFLLGDVIRIFAGDFTAGEPASPLRPGCGCWPPRSC